MANTSSLHLSVGSARNRLPALARISPSPSEESWFPHYKGILHSALLQGRLILSNKTARTVAFFYTLFLHCLVFLVSVWGTGVGTEIKHLLFTPSWGNLGWFKLLCQAGALYLLCRWLWRRGRAGKWDKDVPRNVPLGSTGCRSHPGWAQACQGQELEAGCVFMLFLGSAMCAHTEFGVFPREPSA